MWLLGDNIRSTWTVRCRTSLLFDNHPQFETGTDSDAMGPAAFFGGVIQQKLSKVLGNRSRRHVVCLKPMVN